MRLILKFLLRFQKTIMIFTSLSIVFLLTASTILRYFFKTDIPGVEELLLLPIFWLYFMGGSQASYEDSHISGELLSTYVKNKKILSSI